MTKRHTCVICGAKRNEEFMVNVFKSSWACKSVLGYSFATPCYCHSDIDISRQILENVKKLKHVKPTHLFRIVS